MSSILLEGPHGSYAQLIVSEGIIDGYILHTIYVPARHRGKGLGAQLLQRAFDAVPDDLPILLGPEPDSDCPIDVVEWYKRHGFAWTRSGVMMERPPRAPRA